MSESDLVKRARELLVGVTEGPWAWDLDFQCLGGANPEEAFIVNDASSVNETDGAFIAASRTLVPELLEALEAAEAEKARLRRTLEVLAEHDPPWNDDFLRARAALKGPDNADG